MAEPPDPDELPNLNVEFPGVANDSAASSPVPIKQILKYLESEAAPEKPSEADLQFLRTARVEDADYWIWRYVESDGAECRPSARRPGSIPQAAHPFASCGFARFTKSFPPHFQKVSVSA